MPTKKSLGPIILQPRDLDLFRGLLESRIMTSVQLRSLHFAGKEEAAKRRLRKLKVSGFIGERARRVNEPSILFLTRKALLLLRDHGILDDYPQIGLEALQRRARVSEMTLRHELDVLDVKTAFYSATRPIPQLKIEQFTTWPLLYQFEALRPGYGGSTVLVKPDAFIRIHEEENGGLSEHTFFLEVDRSSETQDTLVARAGCYLDYYKSGEFAVKNGGLRSEYKDYGFRVLIVFKTAERRNNLAERLLQSNPPIPSQAWLSTFDEVVKDPFGKIWISPMHYREVTNGTLFDLERKRPDWGYRRQTERDNFVEKTIQKLQILG